MVCSEMLLLLLFRDPRELFKDTKGVKKTTIKQQREKGRKKINNNLKQ